MSAPMSPNSSHKQSLQSCVVVDHIAGGDSYIVETNERNEKSVICAVSNRTEKIYVYQNRERKAVVQLPAKCITCNAYNNPGGSYFLFGLSDGSIVMYKAAEAIDQDKKKKKKKKKSKHKERDQERQLPKESLGASTSAKVTEDMGIFADLLGNHKTTHTISGNQQLASGDGADGPAATSTTTSSHSVTEVGEESVILKEKNLQDFLVVNDCLVTCAELENGWTLSVYRMTTLSSLEGGEKMGIPVSERSPVYRTYFPKSGTTQRTNLIGDLNRHNTDLSEQSTNQKPCVKCILSSSTQLRPKSGCTPNKLLVLEDALYNGLFGADCNLLDSPVVTLGLLDGRVYQVALKSLRNQIAEVDCKPSAVKTSETSVGLTGNMLYHVQEAVADIYSLTWDDEHDKKSGCQCLVLLGRQGKMVTVMPNRPETSQVQYDEHCISGPVISSCSTATHVAFSTQRALFTLKVQRDGETRHDSGRRLKCGLTTPSFAIGRVCALGMLKSSVQNGAIHKHLMGVLANGKVVLINFPLSADSHGNQSQPITVSAAGQRMKELLHAINNVSIRMHQLSVLSSNQDKVLEELSKACHLAGRLLGGHLDSHNAAVFETQLQCVFQDDGSRCRVSLQCKVTNRSSFFLSHGWTLVLCVGGNADWPDDDVRRNAYNQVTRTVQLKDFEREKTVTIVFQLDTTRVPLELPLEIRWHLYFNLNDFTDHVLAKHVVSHNPMSKIELNESGAVLTFASDTLDLLMMLRPTGRSKVQQNCDDSVQTACNAGYDWLGNSLEAMPSAQPLSNRVSREKKGVVNDGPVATSVIFKEETVETIKKEMTAKIKGPCSQEVLALKWLFRSNPLVLSAISGNQLEASTADGKKISFVCVQKDQGSTSRGQGSRRGKGSCVELTMVTPDYEIMCQLQEAVHRGMKDVLQRCSHGNLTVPTTQLQKQLGHLQGLQRRIETLEDGLVSSQGFHGDDGSIAQVGQDTLEIYRLMRNSHWTV